MRDILTDLNEEQKTAVTHTTGPLLIIAGAGTGKTTVITRRIAHLIEQGIAKPEEIVALTFTEKAAREMSDRIDTLLETSYSAVTVGTFHSFCQQLLERYGIDIGLPAPFRLLTPAQCWRLMKQEFARFDLAYYRPLATPTRFIQALMQHFSRCKDELILPEDYLRYAEELQGDTDLAEFTRRRFAVTTEHDERLLEIVKVKEIATAYHTYTQIMLEHHALDFGDLLLYTHHLLATRPAIARIIRVQHRFITVDEFQDTNWAQYQLLKQLTTQEGNLAVVGDDDQSIYKWRGASLSNILQFTKDFPHTKTVVLTTNYRSAQIILDHAYRAIKHNDPERLEVQQHIDKKLRAAQSHDGSVAYLQTPTGEAETRIVLERVRAVHDAGTPWHEIAVLARANAHLDPFVLALREQGIPYQYRAASGLLKTPCAVTCLAVLRALLSHHDQAALYRVGQMPVFRVPPEDHAALWWTTRKGSTYGEALERAVNGVTTLTEDGRVRITLLLRLLHEHARRAQTEPVGVVLLSFLEQSHYMKHLADGSHANNADAIETLLQLRALFDFIEQFSNETADPSVRAFVEYVDDLLESGDEGGAPVPELAEDAVQLLTVHSAKGLEFEYLYIVNLVERRFPTDARGDTIPVPDALIKESLSPGDHHMEEERRLFYVALTRAKRSVTITGAVSYGGARDKKPSRFIEELGLTPTPVAVPPSFTIDDHEFPKHDVAATLPLPTHYSFSQLKAYETCPLQYKFANVLRIPTRGKPSYTFGQTIHRTLQKFYERIQALNQTIQGDLFAPIAPPASGIVNVPSRDELMTLYNETWTDDWYTDREQRTAYYEEGKRTLRAFYEQNAQIGWRVPRLLEKGFTIRIGTATIRGQIDRIDQTENGGIAIIDYKTGKPKTKLESDDKDQLFLYHIAAEEVPTLKTLGPVVALTFYYLEDGTQQSFQGTPVDLARYKEKILATIQHIEAREFAPDPSPFKCRSCDFREICEFRQL